MESISGKRRFYCRRLGINELSFIPAMEGIELKTQKNAWSANAIAGCFDDSYLITGLFRGLSLIGFSVVYNTKITTDLLTIGVDPKFQGQGLGALLLYETLKSSLDNGAFECFLEVRVSNAIAQSLYAKFGFVKVGLREGYYGPDDGGSAEDAFTMRLEDIALGLKLSAFEPKRQG